MKAKPEGTTQRTQPRTHRGSAVHRRHRGRRAERQPARRRRPGAGPGSRRAGRRPAHAGRRPTASATPSPPATTTTHADRDDRRPPRRRRRTRRRPPSTTHHRDDHRAACADRPRARGRRRRSPRRPGRRRAAPARAASRLPPRPRRPRRRCPSPAWPAQADEQPGAERVDCRRATSRQGARREGCRLRSRLRAQRPRRAAVAAHDLARSAAAQRDRAPQNALRNAQGVPTVTNPTTSLALPGAVPVGVPNFFIDKFRIPPFLLPIYQAAGIQYGIRWEVLAAINEIETDYGRNLNISSAGALGWMQFMPATWKAYGTDANRDGRKDPFNPVDAIFAAARYLRAAGADQDLRRAIFAYNHADWYVESVLMRARLIGGLPSDLVGSLNGLTQGHFPVFAKARYADDLSERAASRRARSRPERRQAGRVRGDAPRHRHLRQGRLARDRRAGRHDRRRSARPSAWATSSGCATSTATRTRTRTSRRSPRTCRCRSARRRARRRSPRSSRCPGATRSRRSPASAGTPTQKGAAHGRRRRRPPPTLAKPAVERRPRRRLAKERLFANPSRRNAYANGGAAADPRGRVDARRRHEPAGPTSPASTASTPRTSCSSR